MMYSALARAAAIAYTLIYAIKMNQRMVTSHMKLPAPAHLTLTVAILAAAVEWRFVPYPYTRRQIYLFSSG